MTVEPKIKKRIDDLAEKTKRAYIEGRDSVGSVLEFALPIQGLIIASQDPNACMQYAMGRFKKVESYVLTYRAVEDFLGRISPSNFGTGFLRSYENPKGYIMLFEERKIVTARTGVKRITEVERDGGNYAVSEPEIWRIKPMAWDGNIESVVDEIEKNENRCVVLAGGAEGMPQRVRLTIAASTFIMHYLEHSKPKRGKS